MADLRIINAEFVAPSQPTVSIVVKPYNSKSVCGAQAIRYIDVTTDSEVTLPFAIYNNHRGMGGKMSVTLVGDAIFRGVTSPGIVSGNSNYLSTPGLSQHNGGEDFIENVNGDIVFKPGITTVEISSYAPDTIDLVNNDGMRYSEPLDCRECGGGTFPVAGSLSFSFKLNKQIVVAHSYSTGCTDNVGGDTDLQPE